MKKPPLGGFRIGFGETESVYFRQLSLQDH